MTGGVFTHNTVNGSDMISLESGSGSGFILGGSITHNQVTNLLFFNNNNQRFVIKNSTITENNCNGGALIYMYSGMLNSTFEIGEGAVIANNGPCNRILLGAAATHIIKLTGGEIYGNTISDYAVIATNNGNIEISGAPQIYGNYAANNTTVERNLYVYNKNSRPLKVTGALKANGKNAHIGLSLQNYDTASYPITSGYTSKGNDANTFNYFFIDNPTYFSTKLMNNEVYYNNTNRPSSTNIWRVKNGSSWTDTSSGASSYTKVYDGQPVQVALGSGSTSARSMASSSNGTTGTNCVNAGTYVFNNGAGNSYKNPYFTVTILPKTVPVTGTPTANSKPYDGNVNTTGNTDNMTFDRAAAGNANISLRARGEFVDANMGNNKKVYTYVYFVDASGKENTNYIPDNNTFICYANITQKTVGTKEVVGLTANFASGVHVFGINFPDSRLKNYLTVTATYNDGTTANIAAANYTISGTKIVGFNTLYANFGGFSAPFYVNLIKEVSGIRLTSKQTTQTIYYYQLTTIAEVKNSYITPQFVYADGSGAAGFTYYCASWSYSGTEKDAFGQWCNNVTVTASYMGYSASCVLKITPAEVSTVNATFTQPIIPIFKTTPINDLKQYISASYVRNDGYTKALGANEYTINGSLGNTFTSGGKTYAQLTITMNSYGKKTSAGFNVEVNAKEVLGVSAQNSQTENQIVYAGYPTTVLPNFLTVKVLYSTDITWDRISALKGQSTLASNVKSVLSGVNNLEQFYGLSEANKQLVYNAILRVPTKDDANGLWNGLSSITDYTLSGTLIVGRPYITVHYGGKTCEFQVTVSPVTYTHFAAKFAQGNLIVYDTSSLETLKPNLTIHTISTNGVAGTTKDYNLSYAGYYDAAGKYHTELPGTGRQLMYGCTNVIKATYINDSNVYTTFRVNVSEEYIVRIEAEWTQPGSPIFVGTEINALKSHLKVTVIMSNAAHNRVLSAGDYTLSGGVTEGQPAITVNYSGITTTFRPTITAVRVTGITATFAQGETKIYTTTPESTIKNLVTVTATYNNGTTKVLESGAYVLSYKLTAGAGITAGIPAADLTVTYNWQDYEGERPSYTISKAITVQDTILVKIVAKFSGVSGTDYNIYETNSAEETTAALAMLAGVNASGKLQVIPYYSKNGKLLGAKPGEALPFSEYNLAIDPKMGTEKLIAGANEIVVSHGGFTSSFSINVKKIALESIEAEGNFEDITIYSTTALETIKAQITVYARYNNKPAERVNVGDNFRLVAPENIVSGQNNEYTVYYSEDGIEKTAKVSVPVAELVLSRIEAVWTPNSSYKVYTDTEVSANVLGQSGCLEVTAYYGNGEQRTIQYTEYTLSGELVAGKSTVTVNYGRKTTTFEIDVIQAEMARIEITEFNPNNVKIYTSTPLNSLKEIMTVMGTMNSGSQAALAAEDYTVTGSLQAVNGEDGSVTEPYITVVYNKNNAITDTRTPITVESAKLDRIEVTFNQNTAGENGKELIIYASDDPAKLQEIKGRITRVTAYYTDGMTESSEAVEEYTLSGSIATAGTATLTVSYNGKSATFNVRVTALAVVGINAEFKQTSRVFTATPLETIKGMLVVKPRYNDGSVGAALTVNEYKLERRGAYEEQYEVTVVSNPDGIDYSTGEYYKVYYTSTSDNGAGLADAEKELNADDSIYKDYVKDEKTAADGSVVTTLYVPVSGAEPGVTIYHIDRYYEITNEDFQPGVLGLFRVTYNMNTALTAEFTANIDSAKLIRIEARWTKGANGEEGPDRTIYTSTPLEDLREWLYVSAVYEDVMEDGDDYEGGEVGVTVITKERIIGDYTLSTVTDGLSAGKCSVAVGYNGLIDTIVVNVTPVEVASVTAIYNQKGKVYESTPLEDLKKMLTITAYNNDGKHKTVDAEGYTLEVISGGGKLERGKTCVVEVTLKEKTSVKTTFTVDVEAYTIIGITASDAGTKPENVTIYTTTALETIKQYIKVEATLADGSGQESRQTVVDFTLSGTLTAGDSVLVVTYNGKITSYVLHGVVAVQATGISASIDQTSRVYTTTELDSIKSMITVNATYNNGTSGRVSDEDYELIGTLESGSTCEITVRYTGETGYEVADAKVSVDVEKAVLTRISQVYTQGDNDIVYATDDIYKLSQWLHVYAHYSVDGVEIEPQEVGGYTLTGELTAGYIPILVTYNGLTTYFNAQITAVSLQGISASYRPTTEVYAATPLDSLKEMIYVEAYYNNGKTEALAAEDYYLSVETEVETENGDKTTYGYFVPGEVSTVTVTYGRDVNMTDKFLVSVKDAQLIGIKATLTEGYKIYYGKNTIEDLRQYLSVVATYEEVVYDKNEAGEYIPNKVNKEVVVTGYTLSGVLEKDKANRISVFYSGAVAYVEVTPLTVELTGLSISYKQTERIYESTPVNYLKSMFEVTALYNDGTGASVAGSLYEIYALDASGNATADNKLVLKEVIAGGAVVGYTAGVRISYTEDGITKTSDATVQVEKLSIIGIEATFEPGDRKFYALNGLDDLKPYITATVQIGVKDPVNVDHTEVVTDYFLKTGTDNKLVEGENVVTVEYNGVSTEIQVYVTPKASVGLVAEFTQITKVFTTTPLFDLKDMLVVKKQYNDGTYELIEDYTLAVIVEGTTTSNVLKAGLNYVNVYYNDGGTQISTTFEVSVEATTLSYITVEYNQTGNIYTSQELGFLVQWLKVWAHYNDSSVIEIITGYNLVGELYAGTSTITVTYGGKQTTFNATVTEVSLVAMSATFTQNAKVYESTSLDDLKSMLSVSLIYNNGETAEVADEDYYISGALVAGENCQMTVVYLKDQSQRAYFYVHVVSTVLDRIEAKWKTGAELPEIYTTTDIEILKEYLEVKAYYVAGSDDDNAVTEEDVYDYTLTTESGKLEAGNARITVNYNGFTYPITVTVIQTVATELEVEFNQGDVKIYESTPLEVLRDLLKVDVTFNDGTVKEDIKDYVITRVGVDEVSISYGEAEAKKVKFELAKDDSGQVITIIKLEVTYVNGTTPEIYTSAKIESVKNLINVNVYYSDKPTEAVMLSAEEYVLEGTIAEGISQLTVRYNGRLVKFDIRVVAPAVTGIRVADFVQGYTKIYDSTPLDNLRKLLTVTATYEDGSEREITEYNITGTLVKGLSCPVTISVGEYKHTIEVQVENVAISDIEANPTLPVMVVRMLNTSAATQINPGYTLDAVKRLLSVYVFPVGTNDIDLNNTAAIEKYKLTSNQYQLTGVLLQDAKKTMVIDNKKYYSSTLTVTYKNTYSLVATIEVPTGLVTD